MLSSQFGSRSQPVTTVHCLRCLLNLEREPNQSQQCIVYVVFSIWIEKPTSDNSALFMLSSQFGSRSQPVTTVHCLRCLLNLEREPNQSQQCIVYVVFSIWIEKPTSDNSALFMLSSQFGSRSQPVTTVHCSCCLLNLEREPNQ